MLVVTGSPRTGTSAMMQTLKILGIEPVSPAFLDEHKNIKKYNKKGFYEPNLEGVMNLEDSPTKVVKLFGSCLPYVKKDIVNKLIIMKRDKHKATKSYRPILMDIDEGDVEAEFVYDVCYDIIAGYKDDIPNIEVNYEDLLENPEKEIERIVEFLQINNINSEEAVKNIDKTWQ